MNPWWSEQTRKTVIQIQTNFHIGLVPFQVASRKAWLTKGHTLSWVRWLQVVSVVSWCCPLWHCQWKLPGPVTTGGDNKQPGRWESPLDGVVAYRFWEMGKEAFPMFEVSSFLYPKLPWWGWRSRWWPELLRANDRNLGSWNGSRNPVHTRRNILSIGLLEVASWVSNYEAHELMLWPRLAGTV